MQDIKQLVHDINHSFLEFKNRNDQRLKELEQGRQDPLLRNQVERLGQDIQKLSGMKSRLEQVETRLNRPAFATPHAPTENSEHQQAVNKYLRRGEGGLTPEEVKLLSVDSDPQGG